MLSKASESECMISPTPSNLKAGGWQLATGVLAKTPHLESCLDAVEHVPSEGRGQRAHLIVVRFVPTNKVTRDDKLMLAFDALALSEMLGTQISLGKIIHGDNHSTLNVKTAVLELDVREHIAKIASLLASSSPPDLVLIPHCAECEFQSLCQQKALDRDDLSLLSGMTAKERTKLHDKALLSNTTFTASDCAN